MGIALRSDLLQKAKKISTKGLPYLIKGVKKFFINKEEIIDLYVLDVKNKLVRLPEEKKKGKLDALGKNFEIKILSPDDKSYLSEFMDFAKNKTVLSDSYIESILKQGVCFLALLNKRVVGVTCLDFNECPLHEFELNFMLDSHQAYRLESVVDKDYRHRGIISLLWDYESDYISSRGYKYIVAAVHDFNENSYIPTLRAGYERYATVVFRERFFRQYHNLIKLPTSFNNVLSLRLLSGKIIQL